MPKSLRDIIDQADELADRFETSDEFHHDPEALLRHHAALRVDAERKLAQAVAQARQEGTSWTVVGRIIGITRQSARTRYSQIAEEINARRATARAGRS